MSGNKQLVDLLSGVEGELPAKNHVLDGDTTRMGRLEGADTYERFGPAAVGERGEISRNAMVDLLDDGYVEVGSGDYDRYGRELIRVKGPDGQDASQELIQAGLGQPTRWSSDSEHAADTSGAILDSMDLNPTTNPTLRPHAEAMQQQGFSGVLDDITIAPDTGYDTRGTLHKSWDRGVGEMKQVVGGLSHIVGEVTGNKSAKETGDEFIRAGQLDAASSPREIENFSEINSVEDALSYAVETVGESAPGLLIDGTTAVATGGIGGAIARKAAQEAAKSYIRKRVARYAAGGAATSAFAQGSGGMEAQLESAGVEDSLGASLLQGSVSSAATFLPVAKVLDRVTGGIADSQVKKLVRDRIKEGMKVSTLGTVTEAPASAIESVSNQLISAYATGNDMSDSLQVKQIIDDTIRGAVGGGAMSAGASTFGQSVDGIYQAAMESNKREAEHAEAQKAAAAEAKELRLEADRERQGAAAYFKSFIEEHSVLPDVVDTSDPEALFPIFVETAVDKYGTDKQKKWLDSERIKHDTGSSTREAYFEQLEKMASSLENTKAFKESMKQHGVLEPTTVGKYESAPKRAEAKLGRVRRTLLDYSTRLRAGSDKAANVVDLTAWNAAITDEKVSNDDLLALAVQDYGVDRSLIPDRKEKTEDGWVTHVRRADIYNAIKEKQAGKVDKAHDSYQELEAESALKPEAGPEPSAEAKFRAIAEAGVDGAVDRVTEAAIRLQKGDMNQSQFDAVLENEYKRSTYVAEQANKVEVEPADELTPFEATADEFYSFDDDGNRSMTGGTVESDFAKAGDYKERATRDHSSLSLLAERLKRFGYEKEGDLIEGILEEVITPSGDESSEAADLNAVRASVAKTNARFDADLKDFNSPDKIEPLARQLSKHIEGGYSRELSALLSANGLLERSFTTSFEDSVAKASHNVENGVAVEVNGSEYTMSGGSLTRQGAMENGLDLRSESLTPEQALWYFEAGLSALGQRAHAEGASVGRHSELKGSMTIHVNPDGERITLAGARDAATKATRKKDRADAHTKASDDSEGADADIEVAESMDRGDFAETSDRKAEIRAQSVDGQESTAHPLDIAYGKPDQTRGSTTKANASGDVRIPSPAGHRAKLRKAERLLKKSSLPRRRSLGVVRKVLAAKKTRLDAVSPELGSMFYRRSGEQGQGPTYEGEARDLQTNWFGKLSKLYDTKKRKEFNEQLQEDYDKLRRGEEAPRLAKFLASFNAAITKRDPSANPPELPVLFNMREVQANLPLLRELLTEHGVEEVDKVIETLTLREGALDGGAELTPRGVPGSRLLAENKGLMAALEAEGMLQTNAPSIISRYIYSSSERAAFATVFGDKTPDGFDPSIKYREHIEALPKGSKERREAEVVAKAITGQYKTDVDPAWRTFNSVSIGMMNLRLLMFSGVASIPELVLPYARSKSVTSATTGLVEYAKRVATVKGRKELRQLADDLGVLTDHMVGHTLDQLYNSGELTVGKTLHNLTDYMFRLNGQYSVVRLNRKMAAFIGRRFLEKHASLPDPKSQRYLDELGISAEQVKKAMEVEAREGRIPEPEDMNEGEDKEAIAAYRSALLRYIDESVLNPKRSETALFADDPHFALFAHLKNYAYAFWSVFHRGLIGNEVKARAGKDAGFANYFRATVGYSPALAMSMVMFMGLGAVSREIRELIKYRGDEPTSRELSTGEAVWDNITRSGMLGPLQTAETLFTSHGWQGNAWAYAAGPVFDFTFNTILNGDVLRRPSEVIPFVNQLPVEAQKVNEILGMRQNNS